ncbi:hypothetical protein HNI00_04205 [Thermoleptolyngbya oregonensis NK1-22]|uniref:Uncharacterized protein n=1 Tax=Thermoleptolyngbya oregonensis NK1-22 TaxID=2547457 RepID=A0AA97BC09_9CYAN|nr:hypothetical protein [Thermoleptolyngbya oregonensis]WOB42444.1 hypothetical protein HNI00_04205 [Thermoleptolyngbya oregonensis NK1-22]
MQDMRALGTRINARRSECVTATPNSTLQQPIYLLQPTCYSLFGADFDAINTQHTAADPQTLNP